MTSPGTSDPVEKKVTASTVATFVVGLIISVLNGVSDNPSLLGDLHPVLQGLLLTLIPTLVTFAAGYSAPHTSRGGPRV